MTAQTIPQVKNVAERRSPFVESLRRISRHRSAQLGFFILTFMILIAIFAEQIAPYNPTKILRDATGI